MQTMPSVTQSPFIYPCASVNVKTRKLRLCAPNQAGFTKTYISSSPTFRVVPNRLYHGSCTLDQNSGRWAQIENLGSVGHRMQTYTNIHTELSAYVMDNTGAHRSLRAGGGRGDG